MKVIKNTWTFEFSSKGKAQFNKLDPEIKKRVKSFLARMIGSDANPQSHWKQLSGTHSHLYTARVGDYRILSEIKKNEFKILAVSIGHRREIYKV